MTAHDPATRNRALALLRRGAITAKEAATLTGMSRQLVHYFLKKEMIFVHDARTRYLARIWRGWKGLTA